MSESSSSWKRMDGIMLGYPFDQLLDQDCQLLGERHPGVKLAVRKPTDLITAGDILDVVRLAEALLGIVTVPDDVFGLKRCLTPPKEYKLHVKTLYDKAMRHTEGSMDALATALARAVNTKLHRLKDNPTKHTRFVESISSLVRGVSEIPRGQLPTGNIVICGKPGTAKSTLALQFAVSCVRLDNKSVPAYIPLETPSDTVKRKAAAFGWGEHLYEIEHIHEVDDFSSADHLAQLLKRILSRPSNCPIVSEHDACPGDMSSICRGCGKPPFQPRILMPSLSPRPREAQCSHEEFFATRFKQLERLLEAGQRLNDLMREEENIPEEWHIRHFLPLIVIDSLNMLGLRTLNREEVYRLFTLFHRCHTTGVFVVETTQGTPFDSTMADVVISLKMEEDQDYTLRYLEVEKSRYYHQVYGRHVFRTSSLSHEKKKVPTVPYYDNPRTTSKSPKHGVVVFPSLHYLVLKTDRESPLAKPGEARDMGFAESQNVLISSDDVKDPEDFLDTLRQCRLHPFIQSKNHAKAKKFCKIWYEKCINTTTATEVVEKLDTVPKRQFPLVEASAAPSQRRNALDRMFPQAFFGRAYDFGIAAFQRILPVNLTRGQVVMLSGPRGTFKTTFALNFLAKGLEDEESVLLIRLTDVGLLQTDAHYGLRHYPRLSVDMRDTFNWGAMRNVSQGKPRAIKQHHTDRLWKNLAPTSKIDINVWASTEHHGLNFGPRLFEIAFKGGFLLPEEFVQIVREILIRRRGNERIRRVVLDDVSQIGVSYPFLRRSRTTGDFFLAAFVHLMRNHHVDFVMTGTTAGLASANDAVSRASALADTVVSCKSIDVFGDRHVIVSGEGLIAGKGLESRNTGESVPAVVQLQRNEGRDLFMLDEEFLEGLVGFEQGLVYRPGILVHAFQENDRAFARYNREMTHMLAAALATPLHQLDDASRPPSTRTKPNDGGTTRRRKTDVSVVPFTSRISEAMHESFDVLPTGAPIDKTVVCTVDEFWNARGSEIDDAFYRFDTEDAPWTKEQLYDIRIGNNPGGDDRQPPAVWPYFNNVLLMAYRKGLVYTEGSRESKTLGDVLNIQPDDWQAIHSALMSLELPDNPAAAINHLFWYERSGHETLSCMFLDALTSGYALYLAGQQKRKIAAHTVSIEDVLSERIRTKPAHYGLRDPESRELRALSHLLQCSEGTYRNIREDAKEHKLDYDPAHQLPPDFAVYICWYSQLRELMEREPELEKEMRVCALPAGGFTGDWSIGVVKGSVSVALGKEVIRKLCSRAEELKRYSQGVGLPVRKEFYDKKVDFFAWPNSTSVRLSEVGEIHKKAHSRTEILNYPTIRPRFWDIALQLKRRWNSRVAKRIFRQCLMLRT